MSLSVVFVFVLLSMTKICYGDTFETTPSHTTGQDVYIEIQDGQTYDISCVIDNDSGSQLQTNWSIEINGNQQALTFLANGSGPTSYTYLSVADDLNYHSNLSVDFTTSINLAKISCISTRDSSNVTFQLGIPIAPVLNSSYAGTINVTEGSNQGMIVWLNTSVRAFPPVTSTWTLDNGTITDNATTIMSSVIRFYPIRRAQAGTYRHVVTNTAGSDNVTFILNVFHLPGGTTVDTSVSVRLGGNVTMTAYTGFASNPDPIAFGWIAPAASSFVNLTNDTRLSVVDTTTKQITITNVAQSDNGTWVYGARNAIGDGSTTIVLHVQFAPEAPTGLTSSVSGTSVSLSWTAPSNTGYPSLSHYIISVDPVTIADTTTTATSVTLNNLRPATNYTITVRAASSVFTSGGTSATTNATTGVGAPNISSIAAASVNGNITLSYNIDHFGGVDSSNAVMYTLCTEMMDMMSNSNDGSGDNNNAMGGVFEGDFTNTCYANTSSNCFDNSRYGSISFGPVDAGESYICRVGIFTRQGGPGIIRNTTIIPSLGNPSSPVATFTVSSGLLQITIRSEYGGVSVGDNTFRFIANATVNGVSRGVYYLNYTAYSNNQTSLWNISISGGSYMVYLYAQNRYGMSEIASLAVVVPTATVPVATATPTSAGAGGDASANTLPVVVGSIVGVVVAIAAVLAIIGGVAFYIMKKKGKISSCL